MKNKNITKLDPNKGEVVSININSANKSDIVDFVINNDMFDDAIIQFRNSLARFAADVVASYLDDNGFDFISNKAYDLALEHFEDFANAKYSLSNDAYGWIANEQITDIADLSDYDDMSEFNEIAGVSFTEFFNLNKMTVEDFLSLVDDWDDIMIEETYGTEESEILHRASMTRLAHLMID